MIVGSIKEKITLEKRVSITPESAKNIIALGLNVCVEKNYAQHLGIQDDEYKNIGVEIKNSSAQLEHEATTSKVGEDQIFYCQQRGMSEEDALSLIVNGFCKEVLQQLPMEFAVEAQKLVGISLEGSVG